MRRSSAAWSSASGLSTAAANSAWENSRPIAAPICAISLAEPSRSSRAIRDACKLAGTASAGDGMAAAVCRALALGLQHRLSHLLHEQRNAVGALHNLRHHIRSSSLLPTRRAMMAAVSRPPGRLSATLVTCDRPAHGALNSGRKATISSAGSVLIWSTVRPNASSLWGRSNGDPRRSSAQGFAAIMLPSAQ